LAGFTLRTRAKATTAIKAHVTFTAFHHSDVISVQSPHSANRSWERLRFNRAGNHRYLHGCRQPGLRTYVGLVGSSPIHSNLLSCQDGPWFLTSNDLTRFTLRHAPQTHHTLQTCETDSQLPRGPSRAFALEGRESSCNATDFKIPAAAQTGFPAGYSPTCGLPLPRSCAVFPRTGSRHRQLHRRCWYGDPYR
jgi:hypothetical protein